MIVIGKHPLIKKLSDSRIEFFHPPSSAMNDQVILVGGKANRVTIPFQVNVLAGGKLDIDFVISENLAKHGVNLLGAYWNGTEVTLYLMPLEGVDVHIPISVPLVVGTLVQVTTYKQVQEGLTGAVVTGFESGVMQIEKKAEKRKPNRKGRK